MSNLVRLMIKVVLLTTVSLAVIHFGMKSVLACSILHCSNIAVWFLHSILSEHVRACKTSTYELFVLRCFAQSWHIWDMRYRSFLWRRIEFWTNTTKYKTGFSLSLKIHNCAQTDDCFSCNNMRMFKLL